MEATIWTTIKFKRQHFCMHRSTVRWRTVGAKQGGEGPRGCLRLARRLDVSLRQLEKFSRSKQGRRRWHSRDGYVSVAAWLSTSSETRYRRSPRPAVSGRVSSGSRVSQAGWKATQCIPCRWRNDCRRESDGSLNFRHWQRLAERLTRG